MVPVLRRSVMSCFSSGRWKLVIRDDIHGRVYMDVIWRPDGTLDVVQGKTYRRLR